MPTFHQTPTYNLNIQLLFHICVYLEALPIKRMPCTAGTIKQALLCQFVGGVKPNDFATLCSKQLNQQ